MAQAESPGGQPSVGPGPVLPDPEVVRQWEALVPGFAEVVTTEFRRSLEHRASLERRQMQLAERGALFALIAALAALAVTALAVVEHQAAVGSVVGGTTVVGLVTVFVTGRRGR